MLIALWAALAMVVQDVLGTLLTQAQARNRAGLAAILDSVAWGAAIATTSISVTALQGHDFFLKVVVISAVTVANVVGCYAGVLIGKRYIKGVPGGRRPRAAGPAQVRDALPGAPGEEG